MVDRREQFFFFFSFFFGFSFFSLAMRVLFAFLAFALLAAGLPTVTPAEDLCDFVQTRRLFSFVVSGETVLSLDLPVCCRDASLAECCVAPSSSIPSQSIAVADLQSVDPAFSAPFPSVSLPVTQGACGTTDFATFDANTGVQTVTGLVQWFAGTGTYDQ